MKFKVKTKIKVEKYSEGLSKKDIESGKHKPEVVEFDDEQEMTKDELKSHGIEILSITPRYKQI